MKIFITFLFLLNSIGCSVQPHSASSASPQLTALPSSWLESGESEIETPTPQAESAVRSVFQAHSDPLSKFSPRVLNNLQLQPNTETHSADWTPWHLDGMRAEFAVSESGIFGVLLGNGTHTIRGLWQSQNSPIAKRSRPPGSSLQLSSETTDQELAQQVNEIVQTVSDLGLMIDGVAMRTQLMSSGSHFKDLCQALDQAEAVPGWILNGMQIQLTFNVAGQITPIVGAGAAVSVFLDWQKRQASTPSPGSPPSPFLDGLNRYVTLISSEMTNALAESQEILNLGFDLDQFQVGLGITAGGEIGVAQLQGEIQGKISFIKDQSSSSNFVRLKAKATAPTVMTSLNVIRGNGVFRTLTPDKLRKGLKKAIKMSSFFVARAHESESKAWPLTQIEAEFDLSAGGDIRLTTANAQAQFILDFDRKGL